MGATFSIQPAAGKRVNVDHLPKAQARRLYRFGQEVEEEMHRYRRQRELEDKRAAAGGINIGSHPPGYPLPADDPGQKLVQLKSFLDQGLISENEYSAKKADILSRF